MKIEVDHKKCDECGTCISVCPTDALTISEGLVVEHSRCKVCGICVKICPFGALRTSESADPDGSA